VETRSSGMGVRTRGRRGKGLSAEREVPYGLRIAADCLYLEENPIERQALELMLDLIVTDQSLSQVAEELNRQGFRTRPGLKWTQVAVFNMLPRLVEASPQIRRRPSSLAW